MYRCKNCGRTFEEPEIVPFRFMDGNTVPIRFCPFCKIKDIEEVPKIV